MNLEKYLNENPNIKLIDNSLVMNVKVGYSILSDILYNFKYDVIFKDGFHAKLIPSNINKITFKKTFFKLKNTFFIKEKFTKKVLVHPINKEQFTFIRNSFNKMKLVNIADENIDKICLNSSIIDFGFESYAANVEINDNPYITINFDEFRENYYKDLLKLHNEI